MIDMTKQYTYKSKPVRIYADGSDTMGGWIHCAILTEIEAWESKCLLADNLVAVWQPKEGELVYLWDDISDYCLVGKYAESPYGYAFKLSNMDTGKSYKYCAPFTGTLPETFKGLV